MEAVVVQSRNILDHLPLAQEHNLNREIIYLAPVPSAVIITRNADIELAAREVALAKSSYHLSSSPGLIMVDEFMVDRFVAVLEKEISSQVQISTKEKEASVGAAGFEKKGGKIKKINDNAVLLIGKAEWKSLKNFPPSSPKNGELAILPTTSMEVSLSTFTNMNPTPPLQIFSNPPESRYLTLFTPFSPATYLNYIPIPHTPFSLPTLSIILEQFPHPSPIFLPPANTTQKSSSRLEDKIEVPRQKAGFQIGFFPQGGMVGMGHLIVGVGLFGVGCWWVGERVWRGR